MAFLRFLYIDDEICQSAALRQAKTENYRTTQSPCRRGLNYCWITITTIKVLIAATNKDDKQQRLPELSAGRMLKAQSNKHHWRKPDDPNNHRF